VQDVAVTDVVLLFELLLEFESGCVPDTLAESVRLPAIVGVTMIVAVKVLDEGIEVQLHVTMPAACEQVPPPVADEET
jgi:hypothetical protein